MSAEFSRGLKITFLVHVVIAGLFGLGFLFIPDFLATIYGMRIEAPANDVFRLIGAAMLGWGVSSWLGYRAANWESVRIVVGAEVVWTGLGALAMLYSLLFNGFPPLGWLNFIIFAAFSIAFARFYFRR